MNELEQISAGQTDVTDQEFTDALKTMGVSTSTAAIQAARRVGAWALQEGVAEVALASTFQNDGVLDLALKHAMEVMMDPDMNVKVKGIEAVSKVVKTRIANAGLTLKSAETAGVSRKESESPSGKAPIFNVTLNQSSPEPEPIPV